MVSGDDPKGVAGLFQFKKDLPLESVVDVNLYTGEFPTPIFDQKNMWLNRSTSFEVQDHIYKMWPPKISIPPWMEKTTSISKVELFDLYLKDGKLDKAWLVLNSTGWSICEAKRSLIKMAKIADIPDFYNLTDAWVSVADESAGGY